MSQSLSAPVTTTPSSSTPNTYGSIRVPGAASVKDPTPVTQSLISVLSKQDWTSVIERVSDDGSTFVMRVSENQHSAYWYLMAQIEYLVLGCFRRYNCTNALLLALETARFDRSQVGVLVDALNVAMQLSPTEHWSTWFPSMPTKYVLAFDFNGVLGYKTSSGKKLFRKGVTNEIRRLREMGYFVGIYSTCEKKTIMKALEKTPHLPRLLDFILARDKCFPSVHSTDPNARTKSPEYLACHLMSERPGLFVAPEDVLIVDDSPEKLLDVPTTQKLIVKSYTANSKQTAEAFVAKVLRSICVVNYNLTYDKSIKGVADIPKTRHPQKGSPEPGEVVE